MGNYAKQGHLKTEIFIFTVIHIHIIILVLDILYWRYLRNNTYLNNSTSKQRPKHKISEATLQNGINLPSRFILKMNKEKFIEFQV